MYSFVDESQSTLLSYRCLVFACISTVFGLAWFVCELKLSFVYTNGILVYEGTQNDRHEDTKYTNNSNISTFPNRRVRLNYKTVYYYEKPDWIPRSSFRGCEYACVMRDVDFSSADAVIFNSNGMLHQGRPPTKEKGALWIFHSREPPTMIHSFRAWNMMFNWTFTYRRDSDVLDVFTTFVKQANVSKNVGLNISKTWSDKTRSISWLVSNCNYVSSKRMQYVLGLKKLIDVDIIGRCGRLEKTCRPPHENEKCIKPYKFYLSFENSMCRDYITEKAFKLYTNMFYTIPITRGYSQENLFLPPNSYLSTNDFPSPQLLVDYINEMSKERNQVLEFFKWTEHFEAKTSTGFCDLCERIHKQDKYKKIYGEIDNWITLSNGNNDRCQHAKDIYL